MENDTNLADKWETLGTGWKFTPLYQKCPRCGCNLTAPQAVKDPHQLAKETMPHLERMYQAVVEAEAGYSRMSDVATSSCSGSHGKLGANKMKGLIVYAPADSGIEKHAKGIAVLTPVEN